MGICGIFLIMGNAGFCPSAVSVGENPSGKATESSGESAGRPLRKIGMALYQSRGLDASRAKTGFKYSSRPHGWESSFGG